MRSALGAAGAPEAPEPQLSRFYHGVIAPTSGDVGRKAGAARAALRQSILRKGIGVGGDKRRNLTDVGQGDIA